MINPLACPYCGHHDPNLSALCPNCKRNLEQRRVELDKDTVGPDFDVDLEDPRPVFPPGYLEEDDEVNGDTEPLDGDP